MSDQQEPQDAAAKPSEEAASKPAEGADAPAAEAKDAPAANEGQGGGRGGDRGGRGGGRGGDRGGRGGGRGRGRGRDRGEREQSEFVEHVVRINRSAAVVKGGRRFSFSALVVSGDTKGKVGLGFGKAKDVQGAVEKGTKDSRRDMIQVPMVGTTIPHEIIGRYCSSVVKLKPAPKGRGIIGCAVVRAVAESAGLSDIVTKSLGNNNPMNLLKATMDAMSKLKSKEQVEALRGVKLP